MTSQLSIVQAALTQVPAPVPVSHKYDSTHSFMKDDMPTMDIDTRVSTNQLIGMTNNWCACMEVRAKRSCSKELDFPVVECPVSRKWTCVP